MLNKQPNDPDVTGAGAFVDENFFNIGIGDHPVQALNALARGISTPPDWARTVSRITPRTMDGRRSHMTRMTRSKFRALTLRQLQGRTELHA